MGGTKRDAALSSIVDTPGTPLELHTEDGVLLRGQWWTSLTPTPEAVVVVAHGFSASMADAEIETLAAELAGAGFDVLTYDARGHGTSEGYCAVGSREHLDLASAVAYAATLAPELPVVLVGVSMGAVAVVGHLATGDDAGVAGAVLVSAPARWRMRVSPVGVLTAGLTKSSPGRWAAARWMGVRVAPGWRVGVAPATSLAAVTLPVAVVHGQGDRLLSAAHGRGLEAAGGGPRRLDVVAGMGHGLGAAARPRVLASVSWVLASGSSVARPAPATTTPAR